MLLLLVVDPGIGLASHIHYISTLKKIQDLKLSTNSAFLLVMEKLSLFRDYFDMNIYDVDKITKDKVDRFYNFHTFASCAAQAGLIESFQKMISSKYFDSIKSDLEERLRDKK